MEESREFLNWKMQADEDFPIECFRSCGQQTIMHRHDCLELNYIESGNGYYIIEDKTYPIRAGDVFIINNQERHMVVDEKQIFMQVIVFHPDWIREEAKQYSCLKPFFRRKSLFSNRVSGDRDETKEIADGITRIMREYKERKEGYQLVIRMTLLTTLALLKRHYETEHELLEETETVRKNSSRMQAVAAYIENHYEEHISLTELGQIAGMSEAYLSTCFGQIMNTTIVKYTEEVRIRHACELLRTTEMQVTEIAFACGYNNLSYFNRSFRQKMHVTPREYRKAGLTKEADLQRADRQIQK